MRAEERNEQSYRREMERGDADLAYESYAGRLGLILRKGSDDIVRQMAVL